MSEQPIVTVIIPAYNHACYICEAIESVLAQTYKNIEILVINDGSSDNTEEVVADYIKTKRIRYIYQENRGLAAARNKGISLAQGRYIKFLDSDDFLYPEQIEKQVKQLKACDNLISISDYSFLRNNGEIVNFQYHPAEEKLQLASFFMDNPAPVHAFLASRTLIEAVGGFDETLTACEDWDVWIRILEKGAIITHLNYIGCAYRILTDSMSADTKKMFLQKCKVVEKANAWLLKAENFSQYAKRRHLFISILSINTKLFDESIARGIPFERILVNALRLVKMVVQRKKNAILRLRHRLIGTENHIRLKYFLKTLRKKNYRHNLLQEDTLWKHGENKTLQNKKAPHYLFFRKLLPNMEWGGTEVVIKDWLSRIDYLRCKITLTVPEGSKDIFLAHLSHVCESINIIEYKFHFCRNNAWLRFLSMLKLIFTLKPSTVIFVQGWYTDFYLSEVLAAFILTLGKVFLHENVGPERPPLKTTKKHFGLISGFALWWHKTMFTVYAKAYLCRKVLFVSRDIRMKFIDFWKYPAHNSLVMYHGTNVEKYSPSTHIRAVKRKDFRIGEDDIIIIAAARLAKPKCLDRLINAFDALNTDYGNIYLLLAGTGPLEGELKALAANKISCDRIMFLGHINNVHDIFKASDIYVLSSDNEGLSLALMEAMASGLICISTMCPGSSEIIQNCINGFLTHSSSLGVEEALRKAINLSAVQKKTMKEEARKTVLNGFDVHYNSQKVLNLFGIPLAENNPEYTTG